MHDIERLLGSFLWTGPDIKASGAKVAGQFVCAPKRKRGLGFSLLKDWNKASMMRHLWVLCLKADTLWIKWIHTHVIKDQSLLRAKIPNEASWSIRKIFHPRRIMQPWVKYIVGDDMSTFLWIDNWHILGPLYKKFGESVVFNLGRSLNTKVASIIHQGSWKWPRLRNAVAREIIASTPSSLIPNTSVPDSVRWMLTGNGKFSAWQAVRVVQPVVPRAKCVWLVHHVPHWAFIEWAAFLGRLSTRDILLHWGMGADDVCCLCQKEVESHEHLFFLCESSEKLFGR